MSTLSIMPPEFLDVDGVPIAYRTVAATGSSPAATFIWLGGYRSDMLGTKAERMEAFAGSRGQASLRFDYSGHGESGGAFKDGTISLWVAQAKAIIESQAQTPLILVGSSMGAWVALRLVQILNGESATKPVAGLVLLAPAPDFTSKLMMPQLTPEHHEELESKGYLAEHSEYSPEPNIFTKALFDDGLKNKVMEGIIHTFCPVHILQGMADPDVPYTHALELLNHLPADDVTMTLIKDGDHRLSRDSDLISFEKAMDGILASLTEKTTQS